jgi:hypothetical protein
MKVILTYLFVVLTVFSCQSQSPEKVSTASLKNNYIEISDGLYKDLDGNIYFKTLDSSKPNKQADLFIDVVYSDKFDVDGIKDMKDVLDSKSFKSLGNDYFQDKNHIYYFHVMSDGGTMSIIDDADLQSFKVFQHSMFGIDNKSVFYRGTKIKGADILTFEPIIIEDGGNKIGWYAKDKNNYYNGYDIMSEDEIKEFKVEIKRLTTGFPLNK